MINLEKYLKMAYLDQIYFELKTIIKYSDIPSQQFSAILDIPVSYNVVVVDCHPNNVGSDHLENNEIAMYFIAYACKYFEKGNNNKKKKIRRRIAN